MQSHYIKRTMEETFLRISAEYPVTLLIGPRQTGKTTMLQSLIKQESTARTYISLDNHDALTMARNDPVMFFHTYKPPILIDEIQYAPGLFTEIKRLADRDGVPSSFWMTGSQLFSMMEGVQESLAGRIALLHLPPLSQQESYPSFPPGIFKLDYDLFLERQKKAKPITTRTIFDRIFKGSMPALISGKFSDRELYYQGYLRTYLERDIKDLSNGIDFLKFTGFVRAAAARTAQLVNFKSIAEDAEINQETAKAWLRILEALGIVFLIRPYFNNVLKRLVKTPKLYFYDTGLVAYLTKWASAETLMNGSMNGAILENYVVSEIMKSYHGFGKEPSFYFYRDKDMKEIDLLLEGDGELYPIEIKKTASPSADMIGAFKILGKKPLILGKGALLCMAEHLGAFDGDNYIIPLYLL